MTVQLLTKSAMRDHTHTLSQNFRLVLLTSSQRDENTRKERAYTKVVKLVEKYQEVVKDKERFERYKEEKTKKEFIEPFFEALGWDIENKSLRDEVMEEEDIGSKNVDYAFRLNGITKFCCEAKGLKGELDSKENLDQAIHYSWNKGCTWAVLTDFKNLMILNSEVICPDHSLNRFREINCIDLLNKSTFVELWDYLSKDGFRDRRLDQIAEKWNKVRKRISIDKQLLEDFVHFRAILSDDITRLNKKLTERDVDIAVQQMLDRLVFIRYCEDKELEDKKLWSTKTERKREQKIKQLRLLFAYYAKRYNSTIFRYDDVFDQLDISNDVLNEIITGLYFTKDTFKKYNFSKIEADVLGAIYEQYLGHILKKAETKARLTDGLLHRKEMGVYYTPTFIVDYIIKNTLGKLLENKKIKPMKLKILDPACGSGSFLTKAYDTFIRHYKDLSQTKLDATGENTRYNKKASILENNIFGVDVDKQALAITHLDLFLRIATKGMRLPQLPNVKQGNSVIDEAKIIGDMAFKWKEKFFEIMKKGGFDIIIGNPPYVTIEKIPKNIRHYFYENYSIEKRFDLFQIFVEKAIELLKNGGIVGYILPNTFLMGSSFIEFRKVILDKTCILQIVDLPQGIFEGVTVDNVILILQKGNWKTSHNVIIRRMKTKSSPAQLLENKWDSEYHIPQRKFAESKDFVFNINVDSIQEKIFEKMESNSDQLGQITESSQGIIVYETGEDSKAAKFTSNTKYDYNWKKLLRGDEIGRYKIHWNGEYLKYGKWLWRSREEKFFKEPKILLQALRNKALSRRLIGTYDESGEYYNAHNLANIIAKVPQFPLLYILAVFNSKASNFWYKLHFPNVNINPNDFRQLPIPNNVSMKNKETLIELASKMLSLNERLEVIGDKMTNEKAEIEEKINKIDSNIDEIIYQIYDLSEKEQKVIENILK
jgi:type I restriction-modification system DNA methylase subunit